MKEIEKADDMEKSQENPNPPNDQVDERGPDTPQVWSGLRERVRRLLTVGQKGPVTKQELAKNRTRSLVLLIGGTVGAVLMFIGVFSTPTIPPFRETSGRTSPNLGRPAAPGQNVAPHASVTPLLNADVAGNQNKSDQLSAADILSTSARATGPSEVHTPPETSQIPANPPVASPQRRIGGTARPPSLNADPLIDRRNSSETPTFNYSGHPASTNSSTPVNDPFSRLASITDEPRREAAASKSSIVFVRGDNSVDAVTRTLRSAITPEHTSLLPPGTRLMARLEGAATTAVKTPVVASIEYNYEHDGLIIVPAGTTAIGEVQQASSNGNLSIRFQTLRMPDGSEEKIEGIAVALDHGLLKGEVSGKNTGKKIVSRTLSGVGTVAAYVVGAGGAGLNSTITGGTLLRDRLASNVALAGDQELMNAAYSQNISVTVPANTRFYVVLQKAADSAVTTPASRTPESAQPAQMPSVQELRELMDLRREINRMYQESNTTSSGGTKP